MGSCNINNFNEHTNELKLKNNNRNKQCFNIICFCFESKEDANDIFFGDEKLEYRLGKIKAKVLERQKKLREENNSNTNTHKNAFSNKITVINIDEEKNKPINQVLEDMCIYGYITKQQINIEKEKKTWKIIQINDILNLGQDDQKLFALGLLGKVLEKHGAEVVIEDNDKIKEEQKEENITCLQFIINGMCHKKKYELIFNFGKINNEELLNDEQKCEEFKQKIKNRISIDYGVPRYKIIVINPFPIGKNIIIQVIFQSDNFNNLDIKEFKNKFKKDNEFSQNLIDIHSKTIIEAYRLNKGILVLDSNIANELFDNQKISNKPINLSLDWKSILFNIINHYYNEDNEWLGINNFEEKWCVAYRWFPKSSDKFNILIKENEKNLINESIINIHSECKDKYKDGNFVGEGVYCTPNIEIAEKNSGFYKINDKLYKIILMVRVKHDAIRGWECEYFQNYWVINGTSNEIRPFRLLYKEFELNNITGI